MAPNGNRLTQHQFGAHAASYLTSSVHARGHSLTRLLELTDPQPGWRVLDVATGAGHTARVFGEAALVVASDLTVEMLTVAREHLASEGIDNAAFCQHTAERLPYPVMALDLVTCRVSAHHFADPLGFVREAFRVLKSGGTLAVADNMVSGEPQVAQFVNTLEKLRDPSHNWAYSLDDWETFFFSAGLAVEHSELFEKDVDFDAWAARMGVSGDDYTRLRALLEQAPTAPRMWLRPQRIGHRVVFRLTEGIVVGRKP